MYVPRRRIFAVLKLAISLFLFNGGIEASSEEANQWMDNINRMFFGSFKKGVKDMLKELSEEYSPTEWLNNLWDNIYDGFEDRVKDMFSGGRKKRGRRNGEVNKALGQQADNIIKQGTEFITDQIRSLDLKGKIKKISGKPGKIIGKFLGFNRGRSRVGKIFSYFLSFLTLPLAWRLVKGVTMLVGTLFSIFARFLVSFFVMPGIADEESSFWARYKRRWTADQIMAEIDSKLFFDDHTRRQIYMAAEQFFKTSNKNTSFRLLLVGPPGCGKTQVAKIFLRKGARFYLMTSGSTFLRYTPQQALSEIRRTFKLRNTSVFFDEADMLIGQRSGSKDPVIKAIRMQLMAYMGDNEMPINIIMTTNDPSNMDGAFRRRFHLIIFIGYPSPATLAKITKHYFKKRLNMTISTRVADSIVDRLKSLISTPVSGAQVERIVEYIRAITVERNRPVTGKAIQEALNGFADEQRVVRESYTGNEKLPPTNAELFKKYFEQIIGLSLAQETAITIIEELEDMVYTPLTEVLIKRLVLSIKTDTIDQGKPINAKIISDHLSRYAKVQNQLEASYIEREEALESRELLQDIVEDEMDIELSNEEADAFIEQLKMLTGEYPSEELLEDLVLDIKESLESSDKTITLDNIMDFINEYAGQYTENASRSIIDIEAPYSMIPEVQVRQAVAVF